MEKYEIVRATEEWQRAGAYSVRIQGMNREHHISLREEFDEHDCDGTNYIVVLDDGYPVATCRFYRLSDKTAMLGRVVVLPEYRGGGLGRVVVTEAEKWMGELGYSVSTVDARVPAVGFYEKLGYGPLTGDVIKSWKFDCVRMTRTLDFSDAL